MLTTRKTGCGGIWELSKLTFLQLCNCSKTVKEINKLEYTRKHTLHTSLTLGKNLEPVIQAHNIRSDV